MFQVYQFHVSATVHTQAFGCVFVCHVAVNALALVSPSSWYLCRQLETGGLAEIVHTLGGKNHLQMSAAETAMAEVRHNLKATFGDAGVAFFKASLYYHHITQCNY